MRCICIHVCGVEVGAVGVCTSEAGEAGRIGCGSGETCAGGMGVS